MDSEALKTFITVNRAGGFSAAAEILGRTQPAISRRIALLEEELQVPLFERIKGGIALSQAGHVLLPYAEQVMASVEDATHAVKSLREKNAGPLNLVVVGTLANTDLTAVLNQFSDHYQNADLSLQTATSAQVSDLVRRGDATLGLRYSEDPSADLQSEIIGSEKLVVISSLSHKFAGKNIKSLTEIAHEKWLAFPGSDHSGAQSSQNIFAHFQLLGVPMLQWSSVDSLTAQKRLVEAGFGLALVPISSIYEELSQKTLAIIDIDTLKAVNPIVMISRCTGFLSPAAQHLMAILRR